jgi:hypothetical protein
VGVGVSRQLPRAGIERSTVAQVSLRCLAASRVSERTVPKTEPPLVGFPSGDLEVRRSIYISGGPDGMTALRPSLLADQSTAQDIEKSSGFAPDEGKLPSIAGDCARPDPNGADIELYSYREPFRAGDGMYVGGASAGSSVDLPSPGAATESDQ